MPSGCFLEAAWCLCFLARAFAGCQRSSGEHFLGPMRLETVHFQRINILCFGIIIIKKNKEKSSNLRAKPSPGGAENPGTTCGSEPGSPLGCRPPEAGAAAVRDNAYFLSLITCFLKKKKKISFGSKIVFYDSVGQDGTHVSLSRFMK